MGMLTDTMTDEQEMVLLRKLIDEIHGWGAKHQASKAMVLCAMGVAIGEVYDTKGEVERGLEQVCQWARRVADAPPEDFVEEPK